MSAPTVEPDAALLSVAVCRACEDLLAGVGESRPGDEVDRALRRLLTRVEGLIQPAAAVVPAPVAAAGPRIEIHALGPTRIEADGLPIGPPRRSRLVLQYLLTHRDRPVARDVLLDLFWPGSSPAAARNSLNVAITLLRRSFRATHGDHPIVVFRDEAYRLAPELDVWLDRERFDERAAAGDALRRAGDPAGAVAAYREADALYGGPLFEDEPYEDWIVTERRAVQQRHMDVLVRLGDSLIAIGGEEEGVECYRRALAIEPEREDVHRRLMTRYLAQGLPHMVLRQFESCAAALRRVLGAAPSSETAAIRERALRGWDTAAPTGKPRVMVG
ncbi:MAG: BTAD domain-containing putative transcriptional regulator [Thermoleophilia bacterium]